MKNIGTKILKVLLGTMLSLSLVACSTDSNTGGNDVIELDYWFSWKDVIEENNLELAQKFNETIGKDKGIKINAAYQGTYDELHAKLQSSFVAGDNPAVSVMEIASIQTFAEAGIIEPLDNYVDKATMSDFYPGLMENSYVNNKTYGVPYLRSTPLLYYNKTLFEKAGINPTKGPSTWKETEEISKKLESIGVKGLGLVANSWYYEALIQSNSGSMLTKDEKSATFNQSPGVSFVQWMKDGVANSNFIYYNGQNGANDITLAVNNQQVGLWFNSTGGLQNTLAIAKENGYEIGTAFIPMNTERSVPTGGCNLVMASNISDKEKAAAAEFINFMIAPEQAVQSHLKTGYLPTRQSIATDPKIIAAYKEQPLYSTALEQLQYGHGRPMTKGYPQVQKIYMSAVDQILTTDLDVKAALDEAAKQADAVL